MLRATSICQKIDGGDALEAYLQLRTIFEEDELFILESMAGPKEDRKKSLVGFGPLFTLTFRQNRLSINGNARICEEIDLLLNEQPFLNKVSDEAKGEYTLLDPSKFWATLRLIEKAFEVRYEGESIHTQFGFFGYFGYDAVRYIEKLPYKIDQASDVPDVILTLYQGLICFDLSNAASYLVLNRVEGHQGRAADEILAVLRQEAPAPVPNPLNKPVPQATETRLSVEKETYIEWVKHALNHIALGDIYQIQVGHVIAIQSAITPSDVYQRMRALNPSPYMYLSNMQGMSIIGASPELFLRIENTTMTMRPIAGTIKRTGDEAVDAASKEALLQDEKERAEHIMLVDLCRNDMGRVCEVNTLKVTDLMSIEQYSHVFHIVSTVMAEVAEGYDKYDVIAATFPAGTVTGAPRIRAMELIEETENSRRGIYGGCIGFIDFRGAVETALCIRTAFYHDNTYNIRASAGIVADSVPEKEWLETISKLSASYVAITGRELKNEDFIN